MKVKLTYFKPSGKYYSSGTMVVSNDVQVHEIFDDVKERKRLGRLPGLVVGARGYHIHIDPFEHPMGYPALIPL